MEPSRTNFEQEPNQTNNSAGAPSTHKRIFWKVIAVVACIIVAAFIVLSVYTIYALNQIHNSNVDRPITLPNGYTLDNYRIAEVTPVSCQLSSECGTPARYLIQSNCPYTSLCLQNKCTVVCPGHVQVPELSTSTSVIPSDGSTALTTGWKTYRNDKYGFEVRYPANLKLSEQSIIDSVNNIPMITRVYDDRNNNGKWESGFCGMGCESDKEIYEFYLSVMVTPDERATYLTKEMFAEASTTVSNQKTTLYNAPAGYEGSEPWAGVVLKSGSLFYVINFSSKGLDKQNGLNILSTFRFIK